MGAREVLRQLLVDGKIVLTPVEDKQWELRAILLPARLLQTKIPPGVNRTVSSVGCGGRIWSLFSGLPGQEIRVELAA